MFNMVCRMLGIFKMDRLSVYFIAGFITLISLFVVPNYSQIKEKLGFDTERSLKVELEKEVKNTEKVSDINEDLKEVIKVHEESTKINIDITTRRVEKDRKVTRAIASVGHVVESVMVDKEASYEEKSEAVIDGLWATYCATTTNCGRDMVSSIEEENKNV